MELWRIFCRQDSIPAEARDATFVKLIQPFSQLKQEADLFNAGRAGVETLLGRGPTPNLRLPAGPAGRAIGGHAARSPAT